MVETEPLVSARRLHFNKSQSLNLFLFFFFYKIKNWVFLNLVYESWVIVGLGDFVVEKLV